MLKDLQTSSLKWLQRKILNLILPSGQQRVDDWSKAGKRVIAVGYQPVTGENLMEVEHDHLYRGIHLLGLAALQDAPREEVIVALKQMNRAGVSVKMITGMTHKPPVQSVSN